MIYVDIYFKKYAWCQFGAFRTGSVHKATRAAQLYARRFELPFSQFRVRGDEGVYNLKDLAGRSRRE